MPRKTRDLLRGHKGPRNPHGSTTLPLVLGQQGFGAGKRDVRDRLDPHYPEVTSGGPDPCVRIRTWQTSG